MSAERVACLPVSLLMVIAMAQNELKRQIGLFDAVMLIVGDMIGTGIFISTGVMAAQVPSPGGVLLVWIFGGMLALAGALSCAELSASLPYAGGDGMVGSGTFTSSSRLLPVKVTMPPMLTGEISCWAMSAIIAWAFAVGSR